MQIQLNPDDIVWSVYQSGLGYSDNDFIIYDYSGGDDIGIYGEIESINTDYGDFSSKLLSTHLDRESAEIAARKFRKDLIAAEDFYYLNHFAPKSALRISQQDIFNLANRYAIVDLPLPSDPHPFNWNDRIGWDDDEYAEYLGNLDYYCRQLQHYAVDVLEKLTVTEHYEAIEQIFILIVGRLAFVRQERVVNATLADWQDSKSLIRPQIDRENNLV